MAAVSGRIGRALRRVTSTKATPAAPATKPVPAPPVKPAPAKAAAAKKAAPVKKAAPASKRDPAKRVAPATKTAPAKKAAPARKAAPATETAAQPVVPPRTDWTAAELVEVRAGLGAQLAAMQIEYDQSISDLNDLQQASTDGAGDDQADAGSKTFEREQELSIAANRLDLLTQIQRAVERIDAGTYGFCESCGNPIPKARLKAFPMATLDVACKQREERR